MLKSFFDVTLDDDDVGFWKLFREVKFVVSFFIAFDEVYSKDYSA